MDSPFSFQPHKAHVGRLFRYLKVGLDGGRPSILSVYHGGQSMIEVLKREPIEERLLAYVTASMNWPLTMADRIQSFHLFDDFQLRWQAQLGLQSGKPIALLANTPIPIHTEYLPAFNYNFDFTDLNMVWPHLREPESDFLVNVYMPNFEALVEWMKDQDPEARDDLMTTAQAAIKFTGEDVVDGRPCRSYSIEMFGAVGTIKAHRYDGYWLLFEHLVPDNPAWNSLRLRLLSTELLTVAEWRNHMENELELAETYTGAEFSETTEE